MLLSQRKSRRMGRERQGTQAAARDGYGRLCLRGGQGWVAFCGAPFFFMPSHGWTGWLCDGGLGWREAGQECGAVRGGGAKKRRMHRKKIKREREKVCLPRPSLTLLFPPRPSPTRDTRLATPFGHRAHTHTHPPSRTRHRKKRAGGAFFHCQIFVFVIFTSH